MFDIYVDKRPLDFSSQFESLKFHNSTVLDNTRCAEINQLRCSTDLLSTSQQSSSCQSSVSLTDSIQPPITSSIAVVKPISASQHLTNLCVDSVPETSICKYDQLIFDSDKHCGISDTPANDSHPILCDIVPHTFQTVPTESLQLTSRNLNHTTSTPTTVCVTSNSDRICVKSISADSVQVRNTTTSEHIAGGTQNNRDKGAKVLSTDQSRSIVSQTVVSSVPSIISPQRSNSTFVDTDSHRLVGSKMTSNTGMKPSFEAHIKGAHCEVGSNVQFTCVVDSSPPAVVVWLKDSQPVDDFLAERLRVCSESNVHTLTLLNLVPKDSGLISARATNSHGSSTCCAVLNVFNKNINEFQGHHLPYFLMQMKDAVLIADATVVFMIKVQGEPIPEIKIYKDNEELVYDNRLKLCSESAGTYEFYINKVCAEDAGTYKCVATNSKGIESCQAVITVTELLSKSLNKDMDVGGMHDISTGGVFVQKQDTSMLCQRRNYQLSCNNEKNYKQNENLQLENSDFIWFKNGEQFSPSERFKVLFKDKEDTLALVFEHVTPDDAGTYTCMAATNSGRISCSAELTVHGAVKQLPCEPSSPQLLQPLIDMETGLTSSVMLDCKVTAYPAVSIQWYINDNEITIGEKYKLLCEDEQSFALIIRSTETIDDGIVKMCAWNDLGSCETQCRLLVKSTPSFKKKMEDINVMASKSLKIEANITGNPTPELKWYKDGVCLHENDRIRVIQETECKFVMFIDRTTIEDAGSYSILASNSMGQMSEFWQVNVQSPPAFLKSPSLEILRNEHENAVIEVKFEGSPMPSIVWSKNDSEIGVDGKKYSVENDGHTYCLIISNLTRNDDSTYGCTIRNQFGNQSAHTRLHVRCPVKFEEELKDMDVVNVRSFSLRVVATGYPTPVVRWLFNDRPLPEASDTGDEDSVSSLYTPRHATDSNVYTLHVETASQACVGRYTCVLRNELGTCQSSAFVHVLTAPEIIEPMSDIAFDENSSALLKLSILAYPMPDIEWRFNDHQLVESEGINVYSDCNEHGIRFNTLLSKHEGKYTFIAANSEGRVSSAINLTVNTAPKFVQKFSDQTCFISENKILSVEISGTPKPEAHWFMDGKEVYSSENYIMKEDSFVYKLVIPCIKYEDAGQYALTIRNHMGEASDECKLIVKPISDLTTPHFFSHLTDVTLNKGQELVLQASVRGNPQPDITWLFNNQIVEADPNVMIAYNLDEHYYVLRIRHASERDIGNYSCVASNAYGTVHEQVYVDVVLVPEIYDLCEVSVVPGESACFKARIVSNPQCRVKWFHESIEIKCNQNISIETNDSCTESVLHFKCVSMHDGGLYTLKAENIIGQTAANAIILLRTAVPTFISRLLNTGVEVGAPLTLQAEVSGLPRPDVSWFKNGNQLLIEPCAYNENLYVYSIDQTTTSDYGNYKILAMNCVGNVESTCEVTEVINPPILNKSLPSSISAKEGESIVLEVNAIGYPKPEALWLYNNENIVKSDRVTFDSSEDGTYRLIVDKLGIDDAGIYRFVVSNGNGRAVTDTSLNIERVIHKPYFERNIENVTVPVGEELKVETRVLGYPTPCIKWLKNDMPLEVSNNLYVTITPLASTLLEIGKITSMDAGIYTILASNDQGEAKCEFELTTEPQRRAPSLLDRLVDTTVLDGLSSRLQISVSAHPHATVTWYKDGTPLCDVDPQGCYSTYTRPMLSGSMDSVYYGLNFVSCDNSCSAVYRVVAENSYGQTSCEAALTVIERRRLGLDLSAPSFVSEFKSVEVNEGSVLLLSVDIAGNPIPDVAISRDGCRLENDERLYILNDGNKVTLTISPCIVKDAGKYCLVLTNYLGHCQQIAAVIVKKTFRAPHFTQNLYNSQQIVGYNCRFIARVFALPSPQIQWFFNERQLNKSAKYRFKQESDVCILTVTECEAEDAGVYTCVASNCDGEARTSAQLDILHTTELRQRQEAPVFLKTIANCEIYPGMQGKFTACVSGCPEPQAEWYMNNVRLLPSAKIGIDFDGLGIHRLVLRHPEDSDVGSYRVRVFNVHGEASCEASLSFASLDLLSSYRDDHCPNTLTHLVKSGLPVPLSDPPLISMMTDKNLTLSWHPARAVKYSQPISYIVEMCELPRGEWFTLLKDIKGCSVEIRNIEPHKEYSFRVRVENSLGVSAHSPAVITRRGFTFDDFSNGRISSRSQIPDTEIDFADKKYVCKFSNPSLASSMNSRFDLDRINTTYKATSRRRYIACEVASNLVSYKPIEHLEQTGSNDFRTSAIYASSTDHIPPSTGDCMNYNLDSIADMRSNIIERMIIRKQLEMSERHQQKHAISVLHRPNQTASHLVATDARRVNRPNPTGGNLPKKFANDKYLTNRRIADEICSDDTAFDDLPDFHSRQTMGDEFCGGTCARSNIYAKDWLGDIDTMIGERDPNPTNLTSVSAWEQRFLSTVK